MQKIIIKIRKVTLLLLKGSYLRVTEQHTVGIISLIIITIETDRNIIIGVVEMGVLCGSSDGNAAVVSERVPFGLHENFSALMVEFFAGHCECSETAQIGVCGGAGKGVCAHGEQVVRGFTAAAKRSPVQGASAEKERID